MSREGQDWQKNKTLGALLGEEQDVHCRIQLAKSAFQRVWSVFRSQFITRNEDQDVESLGQLGTTPQLWDMRSNHNND